MLVPGRQPATLAWFRAGGIMVRARVPFRQFQLIGETGRSPVDGERGRSLEELRSEPVGRDPG